MKTLLTVSFGIFISLLATALAPAAEHHSGNDFLSRLSDKDINRIAFGSCAKQWLHQSIWESAIESKPDLWLFLGDAVYADTDGKTAWQVTKEQLAGEWNRLADKPEFRKARTAIPMLATWDNHDYGSHAGGAEFALKEESKRIFLDFFGESPDSERRSKPGIYDAKIFGPEGRRLQVILLDTRSFKNPYDKNPLEKEQWLAEGKVGGYVPSLDPAKTLLGQKQWDWLDEQLRLPAELRLIVSSIQIIPDQKGMDEWGNFPLERQKLFDIIQEIRAEGVILVSGNVHFGELSKAEGGPYLLYELTSSGMTHINQTYAQAPNRQRVSGPITDKNFGLIEIDWEAQGSPGIALMIINDEGEISLSHTFSLSELRR